MLLQTRGARVAAISYSLLALLTVMVAAGTPVAGLDALVDGWAKSFLDPSSEALWLMITTLGGGATVVMVMVVISLMLWRSGQPLLMAVQWGGYLLSRFVTEGLKAGIGRARPSMTDIERLLAGATNYAFPSGHATSAIYVYGFLALLMMRSRLPRAAGGAVVLLAGVVIAAVALSRLVLGVHFASDVMGGLLSGLGALAVASHWVRQDARP